MPEWFLYPYSRQSAGGSREARASATHHTPEVLVHALAWIGIVLLVFWAVLWLGFKFVSGVIHLLVIAGVVLLIWGLIKKGANAVGNRT